MDSVMVNTQTSKIAERLPGCNRGHYPTVILEEHLALTPVFKSVCAQIIHAFVFNFSPR